jgi:hypothetical protein
LRLRRLGVSACTVWLKGADVLELKLPSPA